MNYRMVLFTLIPIDFLAYVTIQFFQTQTLLWHRFCSYFSDIGPNLAKKIQPPPCSHKDFLFGSFRESIFFSPTTEDEIITIAQSFASGKAAGYDNIPMSLNKESIQIISGPLAHIMKLSIAQGVVLDQIKIARVVPLFKADDQSLFTNYRPVSVLPSFSKFPERIIYNRLYDYLTNLHILYDNQLGFRKNHACLDWFAWKNFICYWSWWIIGWCLFRSLESFQYSQSFHLIW